MQSRMDNLETTDILSTQDTGRRHTQHKNTIQKTKKMSNTDPTRNQGCTHVLGKSEQFLTHITISKIFVDTSFDVCLV